jgi:hypothetical protein
MTGLADSISKVDDAIDETVGAELPDVSKEAFVDAMIVFPITSVVFSPLIGFPFTLFLLAMKRYRGWN